VDEVLVRANEVPVRADAAIRPTTAGAAVRRADLAGAAGRSGP
jgi:hypothetical protein